MDVRDAVALIAPAVRYPGGTWADLGAGAGTFTRALASLLGETGRIYAVDRDGGSLTELQSLTPYSRTGVSAEILPVHADFARPLQLPPLDGALFANALHFVPAAEQPDVLARIARGVRSGGRIVIVEYENRAPSRWVPYPVSLARLGEIARAAGLGAPVSLGARRSAFGGTLYAAAVAVSFDGPRTTSPPG
jgi:ubiquinone/menaquinone biosynthesis C-methylase UbiE